MATKRPHRPPLHFGEKVRILLDRNLRSVPRVEPSTPRALATRIGEDDPVIYRAIRGGNPKLVVAHKIARALGESLDFLTDSGQPMEGRPLGDRFDSFVATLTPAERDRLADLGTRGLRALVSEHQDAIRQGRAALPAKPTGRQP